MSAQHSSAQQAAADVVERSGASPHVVVSSIDPEVAARFDEPEELIRQRELVGPFLDRRAAQEWAVRHYADKPGVVWTAAQVRRPEWVEADVRRLRGAGRPPEH